MLYVHYTLCETTMDKLYIGKYVSLRSIRICIVELSIGVIDCRSISRLLRVVMSGLIFTVNVYGHSLLSILT